MKCKKEVKAQKVAMKEAKQHEKETQQQAKQQEKARQREPMGNKRRVDNISTLRPKRKKSTENIDNETENNRCCTCFGVYSDDAGTDRQWVMCCCNRWIHEDCVDPADVVDGTGKLCPLC